MLMDTFEVMEPTYSPTTVQHQTIIFIITGVQKGIPIPILEKSEQKNTHTIHNLINMLRKPLLISAQLIPPQAIIFLLNQTRLLKNTHIRAKILWKYKKERMFNEHCIGNRKATILTPIIQPAI